MATNYGAILGIQNRWAPILFAVLYFLLMLWYVAQAVRRHAFVFGALAFFSALRVISYSMRAAIASNHHNSAFNKGLATAYEIFYNVSFFSLLLSVNRLLHDRRRLAKINQARDKGRNLLYRTMGGLHKGRFLELLLFIAVILGIVGIAEAFTTRRSGVGNRLNDASTYIFLAATVILALFTLFVIHIERTLRRTGTGAGAPVAGTGAGTGAHAPSPIGTPLHHLVLFLTAVLLLLRIIFYAATVHQRATGQQTLASQVTSTLRRTAQRNEHLWWPLAALPELLVVLLLLTPGLVPLRSLLARHRRGGAYPNEKAAGTGAGYDAAAPGGVGAADSTGVNGTHNGAGLNAV